MGISSEQFRICVGLFNNRKRPITCINSKCQVKCGFACVNQRSKKSEVSRIDMCEEYQNFIKLCILSIGCAIYFYLILYLYFLTIDLAAHCVTVSHASKNIHIYTPIFSTPIFSNNSYVNMNFLLIIVYSICLNLDLMQKSVGCDDDVLHFVGACRKILKRIHIRYENKNCKT